MNQLGIFSDLPGIEFNDDTALNSTQQPWLNTVAGDGDIHFSSQYSRAAFFNNTMKMPILPPEVIGMGPFDRFVHGEDAVPLMPKVAQGLMDMEIFEMLPQTDFRRANIVQSNNSPLLGTFTRRYSSPEDTESGSSVGGGSWSACHSDDVSYSPSGPFLAPHFSGDVGLSQHWITCGSGSDMTDVQLHSPQLQSGQDPSSGITLKQVQRFSEDVYTDPVQERDADYEIDDTYHGYDDPTHHSQGYDVDPESNEFINGQSEEEAEDSDDSNDPEFKPPGAARNSINSESKRGGGRRRSSTTHGRRHSRSQSNASSLAVESTAVHGTIAVVIGGGVSKRKSKTKPPQSRGSDWAVRPFPCPLAPYSCTSTFRSKNEWKRHINTQHIKLGFWRCDLCPTATDTNPMYNDFNRKDLFTQHLRRMHPHFDVDEEGQPINVTPISATIAATASSSSPSSSSSTATPSTSTSALPPPSSSTTSSSSSSRDKDNDGSSLSDEAILAHQRRCYQQLRDAPPRSSCLFCPQVFAGPGSWDERMEHVAQHLEMNSKRGNKPPAMEAWRKDQELCDWLQLEGLIEMNAARNWQIGDGTPRRV